MSLISEQDKLIGPVGIDTDLIKSGKRVIRDIDFPELDGKEIINISKENITVHNNITEQISRFLLNSIEISI